MTRKRLTLLGTSLEATEVTNLAIPMLEAYLSAQPEIADSWDITRFNVLATPSTDQFDEQTVADVIASEPDVLGLNCHCWDIQAQLDLAAAVKRSKPSARVVLGGPSAATGGEQMLPAAPAVDVIMAGEGEERLAQLLTQPWDDLSDMPRIVWRRPDGSIAANEGAPRVFQIDELPSPYLTGTYKPPGETAMFEFARGCIFRCKFCDWKLAGSRVREASFERMRDEIRWAREHGCRGVFVIDSAINHNRKHLLRFCSAAAEADPDRTLGYVYFFNVTRVDAAQVEALSAIRTERMEVGLNTVNTVAMRSAGRPKLRIDDFTSKLKLTTDIGPIALHIILGMPGDDLEGFARTLDYVARQVDRLGRDRIPQIRVFWLVVAPGSDFWNLRDELGIRVRERGTPFVLGTREFPEEDLKRAVQMVQEHEVGALCEIDGPPEWTESLVLPGYRFDRSMISYKSNG